MSWKTVRLGDIFEIARGGSPRPIESFLTSDENGVNWIMIGDTKDSGKYIEKTAKKIKREGISNSRMVNEGDFLLTNSMSFGRPYILKTSGCIHDGWLVLSPKDENIHRDYFYYYLGSDEIKQRLSSKAAGAVVKNLNKEIVSDLVIELPPLTTQKRIAEILDAADALRRKDQELLKKYDELAQAIFIDMFGDPVKNEKGWEVKSLSEILDVDARGIDPNEIDEYNYIGLEHIEKETGKILVIDKGKVVSNKFLFSKDHILYGKLRPYLNKVAVPDFSGICSTDIFPLKPKNKLMKHFLVSILRSKDFVNHSNTNAVGANLPRANKDVILNFKTIVPNIEAVVKYSNKVDFINRQKDIIENEILKSDILFDSLIQKAFNGELAE